MHQILKDTMQKAVLGSPEVQSKWHAFKSAESEVDVARGALRPKIDVTTGVGYETLRQPPTTNASYRRDGYTVTLTQMVYDGFTAAGDVKRLGKAKLTRYFELLEAAELAALEAGRAYYDVMRYRYLLSLAEQNYVEHRTVYEQLLLRSQSGAGRRVDVEHAESRLALAEINLITEQANLHDVSARYMRIINENPPRVMFGPGQKAAGYPASASDALRTAFRLNPSLRAATENVEAANHDLEARRGAFHPRLDFRVRSDNTGNYLGTPGERRQQVAELILSYNLYNGGADVARERQYVDRRGLALDLREKACRDIRQTLVIAYNDVQRLRAQLGFLGIQVGATEKTRDAYRAQFNIGQRSLLDVLDTENELLNARRTEINAEMDLAIAYLRTHAGIGQLLSAYGLKHAESDSLPGHDEFSSLSETELCAAQAPSMLEVDNNALTVRAKKMLDGLRPGGGAITLAPDPAVAGSPSKPLPSAALAKPAAATGNPWLSAPSAPSAPAKPAAAAANPWLSAPSKPSVAAAPAAKPATQGEPLARNLPQAKQATPLPAPRPEARPAAVDAGGETELRSRLTAWAGAWMAKDVAAYLAFYAPSSSPDDRLSREDWEAQRRLRIGRPSRILVEVQDLQVELGKDSAKSGFVQYYEADTLSDKSSKTLEWVRVDGQWLIKRESAVALRQRWGRTDSERSGQ